MRFQHLTVLLLFFCSNAVSAAPRIHQISPLPSYIENIAVRPNGQLLLTSFATTSSIYALDPTTDHPSITTLSPIEGANGITGIIEISPDIFAVAAANFSLTTGAPLTGSIAIWTVDFRRGKPVYREIVTVEKAQLLNGLATIPGSPDLLLASDSFLGVVFRIDIAAGTYDIGIQDPLFAPPLPYPSVGINGIRSYGKYIYFTNYAKGIFERVPISRNGSATGAAESLAKVDAAKYQIDDFAIDEGGNAWIAAHPNALYFVDKKGGVRIVYNGTEVPNPTSAAFARGKGMKGILYITANTNRTTGGVVSVDTRTC